MRAADALPDGWHNDHEDSLDKFVIVECQEAPMQSKRGTSGVSMCRSRIALLLATITATYFSALLFWSNIQE